MKLLLPAYAFIFGANIALYLMHPIAAVSAIQCPWMRLGMAVAIIGVESLVEFFILLLVCAGIKAAWRRKMKLLRINSCGECHHLGVCNNDYACLLANKRYTHFTKNLATGKESKIPDWCPLPDTNESGKGGER